MEILVDPLYKFDIIVENPVVDYVDVNANGDVLMVCVVMRAFSKFSTNEFPFQVNDDVSNAKG